MTASNPRGSVCKLLASALLLLLLLACPRLHAAGVTFITHGLNSNVDDWVMAMAATIPDYPTFPRSSATFYTINFVSNTSGQLDLAWQRIAGSHPSQTESGEIFVVFDWRQLAKGEYSTYEVARLAALPFLNTFISEMNGPLAELPIHLIGHSRGGSVICEMSRILGTNGVWVDHLTTLDPHPLNNDGFYDWPYTVVDAPARTYETVLFHDNYFQSMNVIAYGEPVGGAFIREFVNLDGGYAGLTASHSDVHLWYHGTINLQTPADDWVMAITSYERDLWWTPGESRGVSAGYYYSRIGRGDRVSFAQPAGPGSSRIRDGYNQRWNLGAGQSNNRTALPWNNGLWPTLIKLNLGGTNVLYHGRSNHLVFSYQWAQPTNSTADVTFFIDDDLNPLNGNGRLLVEGTVKGTTANAVSTRIAPVILTEATAPLGYHALYVRISARGKVRYLYAPEIIEVLPTPPIAPALTVQPLSQTVIAGSNASLTVSATGTLPLHFQWLKGGVPVVSATNAVLEFAPIHAEVSGAYSVIVSNVAGMVTSIVAQVTVVNYPEIKMTMTNVVALVGKTLEIPMLVEGTGPFTYRWFRNGRVVRNQAGPSLIVSNVKVSAKGTYYAEVQSNVGSIRSDVVSVTVVKPATITRHPNGVSAHLGRSAAFRVVAKGSAPLEFQWFKDHEAIQNATNRVLTISNVQVIHAGEYSVRVSNVGAVAESATATLTVLQ